MSKHASDGDWENAIPGKDENSRWPNIIRVWGILELNERAAKGPNFPRPKVGAPLSFAITPVACNVTKGHGKGPDIRGRRGDLGLP